ncbi:hypothetical protein [Leptospira kirschneri]|uniref:Uncharacterized protein n=1 Tax=Leptospira kirschneri serovar Bulgarica str. Nikolaevo TaxID=1240687 RepID=M6FI55_9LEPT|nr:hypothetical protein LEP1GSC008_1256 [Leptospira kirschneri serovar Bulgarica str. Nikolaevo]
MLSSILILKSYSTCGVGYGNLPAAGASFVLGLTRPRFLCRFILGVSSTFEDVKWL